jgi:hypothetical protein
MTTAGYSDPLALMDGRRIGRHKGVQFAKTERDDAAIEHGCELASVGINIVDVANVAVLDYLTRMNAVLKSYVDAKKQSGQ